MIIVQGLGSRFMITQGYAGSLAVATSFIVAQGFGSAWLVTQGFGA